MNHEQLDLFEPNISIDNNSQNFTSLNFEKLSLSNAEITFYPHFFSREESDDFLEKLMNTIKWQRDYISLYGRQIPIPRQTAWYGDEDRSYTYSRIRMLPKAWNDTLLKIKQRVENVTKIQYNSVLVNLYRDGKDGVAWHSDDEPELGDTPIIGSVSFGGERRFMLKPKNKTLQEKHEILLNHGSFLLMTGTTQKHWLHQIPKTSKKVEQRINLTFRIIKNL